jgi:hypothetical protein
MSDSTELVESLVASVSRRDIQLLEHEHDDENESANFGI